MTSKPAPSPAAPEALGRVLLPLRAFLGFTFCFAGLQKLANPGGLVLSLMLFLTVSFHSAPYYTGADIVFAFAWTPLLLAGSGSVLSLDAAIKDWACQQAATARRQARRSGPPHRRSTAAKCCYAV